MGGRQQSDISEMSKRHHSGRKNDNRETTADKPRRHHCTTGTIANRAAPRRISAVAREAVVRLNPSDQPARQ